MTVRLDSAVPQLAGRILKVNHAGEHGAINIYSGQIFTARLTARRMVAELKAFRAHERKHQAIFLAELERRGLRRCRSYWLCGLGGLALGLLTGLFGRHAIAATTVAVERVVLCHLAEQLRVLRDQDEDAVTAISAVLGEEQAHHDKLVHLLDAGPLWVRLLSPVVALFTEAIIRLGMRV